ncbi:transcriptional regulator [Lachnoclostridium sp. An169]|uniref:RNA-binding domain-containing protein n=1 Tax=Lachnoclostridium sp. An169 TaxID=1965569 RepID=UPI000B391D5C|nr:RNA-binding domain-containing protein [Lachnoclostridium sp. An169]OUP81028.1 transcriptional regulator [Lachnoclostridium sp. An169]
MQYESEKIEYKETFTPEIYKEVIAFANTEGGIIYIGVNDEGNPTGLENIDDIYTRITNGIRDGILPDVTMFVKYTLANDRIIRIEIAEGSCKPYYLKGKGLKPSGVYVRQGASSVPASPEQIRQMIKTTDGDEFETFRSVEQELTFEQAKDVFEKNGIDFSEKKYFRLGIKNPESDLYTNLGLIISDQCYHTVKIAVFSDEDNTVFQDKKEFSGSVFKQLEEAYEYLRLCNQNHAVISGLEREDHWDYPEAALREALLNALIHRDYSYSGSIIININRKELEVVSIGGLMPGISQEDIRNGISLSRNPKLSEIFHRLRFIEAYGTGIRRIYSLYKNCRRHPELMITQNSFRIVLPNMNTAGEEITETEERSEKAENSVKISKQQEMILEYLSEHSEMSSEEVRELLNIRETRAYVIMKQLADAGLIGITGRGKTKRYFKK